MNEKFVYYCTRRPAAPGTIPTKNLIQIENFNKRTVLAFCEAWARVTYSEPLTPETLTEYELSDNTPEEDNFVQLEKVNALVFFKGTEEAQEEEERKENRNKNYLKCLYNNLLRGSIDYFYSVSDQINGYQTIYICHRSAKYSDLQLTAVTLKGGVFAYMTFDCEISDFKKLEREIPHNGKKIYYASLDD